MIRISNTHFTISKHELNNFYVKIDKLEKQNKHYKEIITKTLEEMGMVDGQKYGDKLKEVLECGE